MSRETFKYKVMNTSNLKKISEEQLQKLKGGVNFGGLTPELGNQLDTIGDCNGIGTCSSCKPGCHDGCKTSSKTATSTPIVKPIM
jgi:hypothetical protein